MRIWFNHWFSTAFRLMELLKEGCSSNNMDIDIIGTNKIDLCVYKTYCDEFYIEPTDISDEDYITWCVDFCKEHNIDYLVRGLRNTSDYLYEENIAKINYELNPKLKTIYFRSENEAISSSMIREFLKYGKPVHKYVPKEILRIL